MASPRWWKDYLKLSDGRCAYCLEQVGDSQLTRDHIIPRSAGGPNTFANLLPCCAICNGAKADGGFERIADRLPAAGTHPLGAVRDGVWRWSNRARAIHSRVVPVWYWIDAARDSGRQNRRLALPLIAIG